MTKHKRKNSSKDIDKMMQSKQLSQVKLYLYNTFTTASAQQARHHILSLSNIKM